MSTEPKPLAQEPELYDLSGDKWAEFVPVCPVCGAEEGQACTKDDPDDDRLAIELGAHVHLARIVD